MLQPWIGENLFEHSLFEINKGRNFRIYLLPPPDIDKPNLDQILIEKIRTVSQAGQLSVAPQQVLDELKAMAATDAEKPLISFPTVAALGNALHYLTVLKPWLVGDRTKTSDTY